MTRLPWYVRFIDPLARKLLQWGVPMGPDRLLTVPGRRTGQPRSVGVAVVEDRGRQWVIGAYGDVNWVRNLRAAGHGTIKAGRRLQHVRAVELSTREAAVFFREVLAPYVGGLPLVARIWVPRQLLEDPDSAAKSHPVFELHRVDPPA